MIAVSENDTLYCLNGLNDTPVWKFVADPCYLERGLIALPDLDGDTIADVVLGTNWGTRKVFAISGSDGSVIWQYDTHEYGSGGWIYEASPMVDMDGDSVIDILASAGGDADRAYLFSGATGIKIWEDSIGYAGYGIREIGDINGDSIPDVAVATGNTVPSANMVKFLDGENGNLIRDATLTATGWTAVPIGDISGDTVPDVACGTGDGNIIAISGADGGTIWSTSVGGQVVDLNLLPDINANGYPELLPSGTVMSSFYCVDVLSGNIIWSTPAANQIFVNVAIPDISGDGISDVVGGTGFNNNVFYCMDGLSGQIFWQLPMGSPVESAYWIDDIDGNDIPDILVGLRAGWIYAMSDGNVGIHEDEIAIEDFDIFVRPLGQLEIRHNIHSNKQLNVAIYSILGQRLLRQSLSTDNNPIVLKLPNLANGVYFIKIDADNFSQICKHIVLR